MIFPSFVDFQTATLSFLSVLAIVLTFAICIWTYLQIFNSTLTRWQLFHNTFSLSLSRFVKHFHKFPNFVNSAIVILYHYQLPLKLVSQKCILLYAHWIFLDFFLHLWYNFFIKNFPLAIVWLTFLFSETNQETNCCWYWYSGM